MVVEKRINMKQEIRVHQYSGREKGIMVIGSATALNELAAWNVHTDTDGKVTPESQLFDDLVRTILTHPEY